MKKNCFFFICCILLIITMQACSKNQDNPAPIPHVLQENGRLKYGGSIAADGIEYYIITDSTSNRPPVYLSPDNLPKYLQLTTIDIPVKITFYYTGNKRQFGLNPDFLMPVIHLISIE